MKRIRWLHSESRAQTDQSILTKWARKQISTAMATQMICKGNKLHDLDEQTFIENANWLGYFRDTYTEGENYE